VRVGLARGFGAPLPLSERFFAGGSTTLRGFEQNALGGIAPDRLASGGAALFVVNNEVRFPLAWIVDGVGFVDIGNVFRRVNQIEYGELRPAVGFGVRFRSPIGPVRADLGFNLNRRLLPGSEPASQVRERGLVFHISLGQAF
jgi:outer membrane protein assembly factor BamA